MTAPERISLAAQRENRLSAEEAVEMIAKVEERRGGAQTISFRRITSLYQAALSLGMRRWVLKSV